MHSQHLLRFVILADHADTGVRTGIFSSAYSLQRRLHLDSPAYLQLTADLHWLDANLSEPTRFNRTRSKGFYRRTTKGISWLKSGAHEHISRMRSVSRTLSAHGIPVEELVTTRPGYVVYEDEFQLVAEPFREAK